MKEPTRNTHIILDLVLSSQPQLISDVSVIPGMSDHEAAVKFQLNLSVKRLPGNQYRKVYQYHKANLVGIKQEMERYKQAFLSSAYELTVEENWSNFKEAVMNTHIPFKMMRPYKDIPWLNHNIKSEMRERKKL